MASRNDTVGRLLPKISVPDADRGEESGIQHRASWIVNASIVVISALLLVVVLIPRVPRLNKGDIATRDIIAPATMSFEYDGPGGERINSRVSRGELIAEAGQRVSDRAAGIFAEMARREGIGTKLAAYSGLTLLILLLFYLFYRDVKRYRPALITDTRKIVLLAFLLIVTILVSQVLRFILLHLAESFHLDSATVGFALPVASGAMLVSLLLDFHLALAFTFIVSLLLGMVFAGDPFMPLFYFVGSITAALYVIRCKKRTVVVRAAIMTALVNCVAVIGIDLYRGEIAARGVFDIGAGLFGAVVTAMIVQVTLPIFEAVFDIATDIKLLELLDPNQLLLKELVYKSPGTYHHSILIGNLAEAAAEAIGENPLLARVGAYYHDIGKIQKPEYFIENQRVNENKHDRLSPSMSSLIITSHVKDGVEIARQHKLPSVVIDIIRQHHGTSLITFFYQKAKELQPEKAVAEQDFRYPGPRPRTKLAAIVMLADAVEAASRTLADPTPERIQGLTNSVITRIFLDDQLSMCDLTLKNLREIAKSFNMVLTGIFHHRIDYPGIDFAGPKKRSDYPDKKHTEEEKTAVGDAGTA